MRCGWLLRACVATLPYGFYLNLVGLLGVLVAVRRQYRGSCLDPLTRTSLLLVTLGMVLSVTTAIDRGEAALQLTHFLPFFWLFTLLPLVLRSPQLQGQLARDIVVATLPINMVAIAEYCVKTDRIPAAIASLRWVAHWQDAPHLGRAMVMFDHPNALANYLVITFGLGVGLLMAHWPHPRSGPPSSTPAAFPPATLPAGLWAALALTLVGLFCSGSRNGLLVVTLQILAVLLLRFSWTLLGVGILGIMGLGLAVSRLGLGIRTLEITQVMDDPRVGVWTIAMDMIQLRPWLGWGPGSFKVLYPERLINPDYAIIFHPHNLWLLLGAEYGLPVMILLTATVGFICYRGVRAVRAIATAAPPEQSAPRSATALFNGYALAFCGSVGFSLLDVTLYDARINVMNWVLLAAMYSWTLHPSLSTPPATTAPLDSRKPTLS